MICFARNSPTQRPARSAISISGFFYKPRSAPGFHGLYLSNPDRKRSRQPTSTPAREGAGEKGKPFCCAYHRFSLLLSFHPIQMFLKLIGCARRSIKRNSVDASVGVRWPGFNVHSISSLQATRRRTRGKQPVPRLRQIRALAVPPGKYPHRLSTRAICGARV